MMKPGAMIRDVACDDAGAVETCKSTTHDDPVYYVDGILHYAVDLSLIHIFTVETADTLSETDDVYYFKADGKYLTSGETGNSLTLEEEATEYSQWVLKDAENGKFIKNTAADYNGKPQYIEYYNNNFTTFGMNAACEEDYTLQFYYAPEDETEVDPENPIKDGDKVVIYAPAYGKALSSDYKGY